MITLLRLEIFLVAAHLDRGHVGSRKNLIAAVIVSNIFVECFIKYVRKDSNSEFNPTELVAIRIYWNPGATSDVYPIQPTTFKTKTEISTIEKNGTSRTITLTEATSWDTYIEKRLKYAKENGKPTDKKLTKHIIEKSSKSLLPDNI